MNNRKCKASDFQFFEADGVGHAGCAGGCGFKLDEKRLSRVHARQLWRKAHRP